MDRSVETWHDDVQCFAVRSGEGEDLATFFLDVSQPEPAGCCRLLTALRA